MSNQKVQLTIAAVVAVLLGFWLLRNFNSSSTRSQSVWFPSGPQARLPTVKLYLGFGELQAEVARRREEIMTGMMFRTNMASNEAMIFLLPVPQQASFYMSNTLIPLSCAYIDDDGVILETHDMKPRDATSIFSATANIRYVLEVNRGWFETNHIGPGTLIRTEKGELSGLLHGAW